jgi:hypothetical protein
MGRTSVRIPIVVRVVRSMRRRPRSCWRTPGSERFRYQAYAGMSSSYLPEVPHGNQPQLKTNQQRCRDRRGGSFHRIHRRPARRVTAELGRQLPTSRTIDFTSLANPCLARHPDLRSCGKGRRSAIQPRRTGVRQANNATGMSRWCRGSAAQRLIADTNRASHHRGASPFRRPARAIWSSGTPNRSGCSAPMSLTASRYWLQAMETCTHTAQQDRLEPALAES